MKHDDGGNDRRRDDETLSNNGRPSYARARAREAAPWFAASIALLWSGSTTSLMLLSLGRITLPDAPAGWALLLGPALLLLGGMLLLKATDSILRDGRVAA